MVGQYESYKSFTMPHLYRVVEVRTVRLPGRLLLPPRHALASLSRWRPALPPAPLLYSALQLELIPFELAQLFHSSCLYRPPAVPLHTLTLPSFISPAAGHRHLLAQVQHRVSRG